MSGLREVVFGVESYMSGLLNVLVREREASISSVCQYIAKGSSWENYFVTAQSLVLWEDPKRSLLAICAVNSIFWFLVWCQPRIYVFASVLTLVAFLRHQWVYSIWPEIRVPPPQTPDDEDWTAVSLRAMSAPELARCVRDARKRLQDSALWLLHLRRSQPTALWLLLTIILCLTALIGHIIPGVLLLYFLLMGFMVGPGIALYVIPDSFYTILQKASYYCRRQSSKSEFQDSFDQDLADFLPESNSDEAQAALGVPHISEDPPALEITYVGEEKEKSVLRKRRAPKSKGASSSQPFTSNLSKEFLSYESESSDDLQEEDLALPVTLLHTKEGKSVEEMKFNPTHFGDSSEEDDVFSVGLTFEKRSMIQSQQQPYEQVKNTPEPFSEAVSGVLSAMISPSGYLTTLGHNIMSSVLGGQAQVQPVSNPELEDSSSADEDFELISDKECQ